MAWVVSAPVMKCTAMAAIPLSTSANNTKLTMNCSAGRVKTKNDTSSSKCASRSPKGVACHQARKVSLDAAAAPPPIAPTMPAGTSISRVERRSSTSRSCTSRSASRFARRTLGRSR